LNNLEVTLPAEVQKKKTQESKVAHKFYLAFEKYHFFTDTGDINDPHAFKSTLPPTSQTQDELPDKDKAISSATDTENKLEKKIDPDGVKSAEVGKNLNSSSDSGSSANSVEIQKEDQNTRDSDSREAAEQLAKTPEEEVDDDNDVYLVR
jgi:hypothetical protein